MDGEGFSFCPWACDEQGSTDRNAVTSFFLKLLSRYNWEKRWMRVYSLPLPCSVGHAAEEPFGTFDRYLLSAGFFSCLQSLSESALVCFSSQVIA